MQIPSNAVLCKCTSVLECFHSQQPATASHNQQAALRLHEASFFCMHKEHIVPGNLYTQARPLINDWWVWEYKHPSSLTTARIACEVTTSLQSSLQNCDSYLLWGFVWHPTSACLTFPSLPHVPTTLLFLGNTSYLKSPVTARQILDLFLDSFRQKNQIIPRSASGEPNSEKAISYSAKPPKDWLSLRQELILDLISYDQSYRVIWTEDHNLCLPFYRGFGHEPWQPLWVWEVEAKPEISPESTLIFIWVMPARHKYGKVITSEGNSSKLCTSNQRTQSALYTQCGNDDVSFAIIKQYLKICKVKI